VYDISIGLAPMINPLMGGIARYPRVLPCQM
jgi:hypothetical protein